MSLRKKIKRWIYGSCPGLAGRFPYFGLRVYFPPGSLIFDAVCETGIFEAEIVKRLIHLARPETVMFDVGANIGLMAVPVLQGCPKCRVISFEPSPSSLPYLRQTVTWNHLDDRWTIVPSALADISGELDFQLGRSRDALFEGFRSGRQLKDARTIKVPVSTLDVEWGRLQKPVVSVVKIDVEGAEALVLHGGAELFATCRPHILLEWDANYLRRFGTKAAGLLEFSRRSQYRIYTIPGGIPVDDEETLEVQMIDCSNFLLVPLSV